MKTNSNFIPDDRSAIITLLLWFFYGTFGAYLMYIGKIQNGILMLIFTILGILTISLLYIGILILSCVVIWWFVDLVKILKTPKLWSKT